jgi:hypothetical protein
MNGQQLSGRPRSVYGSWFLAVLLRSAEQQARYGALMRERIPAGGLEQMAIAARVFQRLMARQFTPDQPVRDISDFVASVRASMARPEAVGRLEAEALIRYALGEETVFLHGIDAQQAGNIYAGLSVKIILIHRLSDAEVTALVVEAEQWVESRGTELILL